jgi:hypothetical protein
LRLNSLVSLESTGKDLFCFERTSTKTKHRPGGSFKTHTHTHTHTHTLTHIHEYTPLSSPVENYAQYIK